MISFGLRETDLRQAARSIAAALGVDFRLHSSSFRGGDYYRAEVPEGVIFIQSNIDLLDDEQFENDWPKDHALLLFDAVANSAWDAWLRKLASLEAAGNVKFLRATSPKGTRPDNSGD